MSREGFHFYLLTIDEGYIPSWNLEIFINLPYLESTTRMKYRAYTLFSFKSNYYIPQKQCLGKCCIINIVYRVTVLWVEYTRQTQALSLTSCIIS